MMRRCPLCGQYMNASGEYLKERQYTVYRNVYRCNCGYQTEMDRSGLTFMNISDRYHFMHEENKK